MHIHVGFELLICNGLVQKSNPSVQPALETATPIFAIEHEYAMATATSGTA
jgi:hypothetical protein